MHSAAIHLAPVLAAEKSKVPFYIAGGALVVWALFVALALGMRKGDFPGNQAGQRAVSAITAVLVLLAAAMAVVTSGSPAKDAAAAHPLLLSSAENVANPGPPGSAAAAAAPAATPAPAPPTSSTPSTTPAKSSPAPAPATSTQAPAAPKAAGETALKLAANPAGQLSFDAKTLTAKAGKVTIAFANASPVEHNVAVALGSKVEGSTPIFSGGSKTLTLTLKAGTYTFFCAVPGHRQAGMEGTLTVQ